MKTLDLKHCGACNRSLPHSCFQKRAASGDGLQAHCIECRARGARVGRMRQAVRVEQRPKECKSCGEVKPPSEYYAHRNTQDRLFSKCKDCIRAENRARYHGEA